jgi:hypothetical protein
MNPNEEVRSKFAREAEAIMMVKTEELLPIMAQTSDPLGSYTGTSSGRPGEMPTQDADDL